MEPDEVGCLHGLRILLRIVRISLLGRLNPLTQPMPQCCRAEDGELQKGIRPSERPEDR